jgi:CheY-like chemotaxis protein
MTATPRRVLVVEDDALIALSLSDMLEQMGLLVCATADTAQRAVELVEQHRPDLVMMDIRLRGKEDGIDAVLDIQRRHPTPIIYVTGSCEQQVLDRIASTNPAGVLIKPILPEQLKAAVDQALIGRQ